MDREIDTVYYSQQVFDFRGRPVIVMAIKRELRREKTASEHYTNRIEPKTTGRIDPYWILYGCIAITTV